MRYRFEHQIETLAHNGVGINQGFQVNGLHFSHWEFDGPRGWIGDAWLVEANIEANCYKDAAENYWSCLRKTVPRIAFVSQCSADYPSQSWLVVREDLNVAFLRYTEPTSGVGLMFDEESLEALKALLVDKRIPDEFFYYWSDAVNTVGYSAKLLLMFSALEALVADKPKEEKYKEYEKIFGEEHKKELFGVRGESDDALRNRLVHGEYFEERHFSKNYVDVIHKKVIAYFNDHIFKKTLISPDIVNPQRHMIGNRAGYRIFIRPRNGQPITLKSVLVKKHSEGDEFDTNYEVLGEDDELRKQFLRDTSISANDEPI